MAGVITGEKSGIGNPLCECGCGGVTSIAKQTITKLGHVKGEHVRYIAGHHQRGKKPHNIGGTDIEERMFKLDAGYESKCWQLGQRDYPQVRENGRYLLAYKVMYEKKYGQVPEGDVLDHLCRNPKCINPDHVEAVWQAINVRRGDSTKLTEEDVVKIRKSTLTEKELSKKFPVSGSQIGRIRRGERWPESR